MPEFLLLSFEIAGTVAFAVSGAILGLETHGYPGDIYTRSDYSRRRRCNSRSDTGNNASYDFPGSHLCNYSHSRIHTRLYHSQKVFYIWRKMV